MKKIVFFLQTVFVISEKQENFWDLACYLSSHQKEYEIYYVNNMHDSDLRKHAAYSDIYITPEDIDESFDGAVFITPVNYLGNLLSVIKNLKNAKICLFSYAAQSIDWLVSNTVKDKNVISRIRELITSHNACAYYDFNSIFDKNDYLDYSNEIFIPRCLAEPLPESIDFPQLLTKDSINVGFVGNIDTKAINGLENIINSFCVQNRDIPINIHIIGPARNIGLDIDFQKASRGPVRLIYTGNLKEFEEKRDYIQNYVDIVFATGSAALEASLFGCPVAIPICDDKKFYNNQYVYLFDVSQYSYSWDVKGFPLLNNESHTLKYIIDDVYDREMKVKLAKKCVEYVKNNASLEVVCEKVLQIVKTSTLTVTDCLSIEEIQDYLKIFEMFQLKYPQCDFNDFNDYKENGESFKKKIDNQQKNKKEEDPEKTKQFIKVQDSYEKKIKKLRKLKRIKVGFLVTFKTTFPGRPVFVKMIGDSYFDPYIIVTPNVFRSMKYQIDLYKDTYDALHAEFGERVINGYDILKDEYLDLGEEYNILFFANPYKHYDHPFHNVEHFLDKNVLSIYLNYGFPALNFWDEVISFDFYNYIWKISIENESNLRYLQEHETIKGRNGIVTGYIKADDVAREPIIKHERKMILICPHHTVFGWSKLNISNFLKYADLFLTLPKKYPDIDFVFRPHPLLWTNLINTKIWSQKKIDSYLKAIDEMPNMVFDESDYYFDKFVNSDAMIHDCGSFIAEYLFTKKPCCYMMKTKETTMATLTPFGQKCMENYYPAFCENDIIDFIDNVVIRGQDTMKKDREKFIENELMINYPNATQSLIDYIKSSLNK